MVFSSHIFLFYFLPIALLLYYASPRAMKHLMLTLMSYVFYGWWNPWFTLLMLGSTIIDYACGKMITADGASEKRRKAGMYISVIMNLSVLAFFKYSAFFATEVSGLSQMLGLGAVEVPEFFRTIVLPVGISFYTFQSMSYSIDLYRGHAVPARNFIDFACYVSMFPQLVAGPIVRYGSVADQLQQRDHTLPGFVAGFTRFNFGFAKKIILANPMGNIADACFGAGEGILNTPMAWIGVTAYAFQIYFDFSAYSDMAIGLGRMFGFRFPENFNSPYKSKSITEFWRRWHISLSSFLRDYLYIPLGGNRKGEVRTYINLMLVMLIGGLWHGASWNFVVWGAIHGAMLAFERLMGKDSWYGKLPNPLRVAITFIIVLITWVFFRAENFEVAQRYLGSMFGFGGEAEAAGLLQATQLRPLNIAFLLLCFVMAFFAPRTAKFLEKTTAWKIAAGLVLLYISVRMLFTQGANPFLYFQF
ncbi:MAG: MBOAT family protein [Verrucomicrobiales bacterium]|nr:MBOAT family protein [Verrucomicrobiales bacterium]